MQIGKLNKLVTLQYQTVVSDGMGGMTATWNDGVTLWAAIWPLKVSESIDSMQLKMEVTHRIRLRYRPVLCADWRIKFGNRLFKIVSKINPEEKNEWLDLICKETAA